ncbi:MAG: dTDP-glucose 4,6-dehydratase [Candidatus Omnitrophica bacterium]|nr:dTDP-glucose 4,6-dehydratase [Candidatus Omnitrophota bacterium]
MKKIIVTGGAGFIGSAFVKLLVQRGMRPIVIDKLSYAGDLSRLADIKRKFTFYKVNIYNRKKIIEIVRNEKASTIVHCAAETHVDRSIKDAKVFLATNIEGTHSMLEAARSVCVEKFIHISTDEVYGDIAKGSFTEDSPLRPNSPYAASKAAGDLLVRSYIKTYQFPAIIVRPSNNYGPWQYPEKLIPLSVLKVLRNEKIPVYAKGHNVREWLFVQDCVEGILSILNEGRIGEVYNLGSNQERRNIEVVYAILKSMHATNNAIAFVKDRPGHDIRYRLDSRKITHETGWRPRVAFQEGIAQTVSWCQIHQQWLRSKWKRIAYLYQ